MKDNRLPFQAQSVYDEILAKMKSVLRESKLTKQTRIEMEFNQLEMGRLPHSAFLTERERMLIAMDDAEIALPDAHTLFRDTFRSWCPSSARPCSRAPGCLTSVRPGSRRRGQSVQSVSAKRWKVAQMLKLRGRW